MNKSVNIQYLDTLRTLAIIGVIVIHNTTPILKMMYGKNMEYWWIGNLTDSLVRYVIAVFLLLSGATMLSKEYNLREFYIKRFMRVLVPFVFWLVVYWIYRWWELAPKVQPVGFQSIWKWGIDLFLKEGVSKHFWYIYMILFIYLFVPFINKWVQKNDLSTIAYILIAWIILNVFVNAGLPDITHTNAFFRRFFNYFLYTGYLLLGFYLYKLQIDEQKLRKPAIILFALTVLYAATSTYLLSKNANKLDMSAYGSLTVNTMLQSIALFIIFKNSNFTNRIISAIIKTISNYSYGIYLVHIMVISILFNNKIFWTMSHPLLSLPLLISLTLLISTGIIAILRIIPGGKYISG